MKISSSLSTPLPSPTACRSRALRTSSRIISGVFSVMPITLTSTSLSNVTFVRFPDASGAASELKSKSVSSRLRTSVGPWDGAFKLDEGIIRLAVRCAVAVIETMNNVSHEGCIQYV